MLQEFLTALHGIPGDVFIEDNNGIIKIVNELPFIVPSEQSLMNEVCILGTYYRKMQKFIQSYSSPLINKDTSGLYKVSLSYGIMEALSDYRNDLVKIEKELLIDPYLSASYVKSKLNDYFILFPTLWKILDTIIERKLRGCQILDEIFRSIPVGNYKIKNILNKILNRCNHVFYRQLSAWILRGALYDPYNEFFIEPVIESSDKKSSSEPEKPKSGQNFIDNLSKSELTSLLYASTERRQAKCFKINMKNVPCFLPVALIKKVLIVGESVHFFDKTRQSILINDWSTFSEGDNKLQNELSEKFGERLIDLQKLESFNLLKLQEVIETVEKYIMSRMWSLLVEENRFLDEYSSELKDFLLLGRGELFMVFITNLDRNLIDCPLSSATEAAINQEFLRASRAVFLDMENLGDKFQFRVTRKETDKGGLRWEDIELSYKVRWPFHIVYTPEVMKSYNDLFQFLIMLKRAQMYLNRFFTVKTLRGLTHLRQWQLRNHMSFFVNHLQYYIQVDVIESQISIFQKKVMENRDIEQLKATHENLVRSLKSHSFLFNGAIHSGLVNICQVCIEYANLIDLNAKLDPGLIENVSVKLQTLQERFYSLSTTLFNILNNVEGHEASNPHLKQLLVKLDFNSFFSVLGSEIGSLRKNQLSGIRTYVV